MLLDLFVLLSSFRCWLLVTGGTGDETKDGRREEGQARGCDVGKRKGFFRLDRGEGAIRRDVAASRQRGRSLLPVERWTASMGADAVTKAASGSETNERRQEADAKKKQD